MSTLQLNEAEWTAIRAACDTIVPAIMNENSDSGQGSTAFWQRSAGDLGVAERLVALISGLTEGEKKDFKRLLKLLTSPLLGLSWGGPLKNIAGLDKSQREKLFQRWSKSPVNDLRKSFQTIKKLAAFLSYSDVDGQANPNWSAIGYPGPLQDKAVSPLAYIIPETVIDEQILECDVAVIGSGAGGGVVAGLLSEAGRDVIVVEKGPYLNEQDFVDMEAEMISRSYESRGALVTRNGSVMVLAGSCLGGGTTVNWAGAFRTPDYVLESWAKNHGNPQFLNPAFQKCFEAVEHRTGVKAEGVTHNPQNSALLKGATKLGYQTGEIPRNVRGCLDDGNKGCGYCGFGCHKGCKQGVLNTYLTDAYRSGARFLPGTEVSRIIHKNGLAEALEARQYLPDGTSKTIKIKAKKVVVAAGAIHTPAILLRSGIEHPQIGRNLYLHPTVATAALYPEKMNSWWGAMMSAVSDEFTRLTGDYGFKLETPPIHSGMLGLAMPWISGRQHKSLMLEAANIGSFIVLTRDRDGGQVTIDRNGRPVLNYNLSDFDRAHLLTGMKEAGAIHIAAGAERVILPHNQYSEIDCRSDRAVASLQQKISELSWKPNSFSLFSAHQMGTCRMGGDPKNYPVTPEGALYQLPNVFVADTSVFPESSGSNPMLSAQAIAHYISQHV